MVNSHTPLARCEFRFEFFNHFSAEIPPLPGRPGPRYMRERNAKVWVLGPAPGASRILRSMRAAAAAAWPGCPCLCVLVCVCSRERNLFPFFFSLPPPPVVVAAAAPLFAARFSPAQAFLFAPSRTRSLTLAVHHRSIPFRSVSFALSLCLSLSLAPYTCNRALG